MPRLRPLVSVLAALILSLITPQSRGASFRFPEAKHGKGELKYINGLPVLTVAGTPEEIGEQVGVLAVKPASRVLDYPKALLDHFSAGLLWGQAIQMGKQMVEHFPAEYRKEMRALSKASGADWDKVVAGNTLFDIKKMILCSALMIEPERSRTRGPLLGRNLDYPSLGWIQEYSLVTVYRPKGKHALVSIGFPGLVGCLSGMNDAGLTVAVLEVFGARSGEGRFDSRGTPYGLCFRTLLQDCTTIAEAKKRLEKMHRTTLLNLVVADRSGVGVLEMTPKSVVLRQASKGALACTNHFCTALEPKQRVDIAHSYGRFDVLEKARQERQRLTPEDLRRYLNAVNLGDQTLQTMVFEPAALKLHLGIGSAPSSRLPLKTLDLAKLLRGK
jgi:isopenicillin-N N-acyltransferase like protein